MKINVLDHGYVELILSYGSDEGIIEDARMSTNKGFQGWDKDTGLLNYLYDHKHMTPFEGCGLKFEIKAPIFVFREWQRHRTQSYNEMSARYIPLPNENYLPFVERILTGAMELNGNKQAAGIVPSSITTVSEAENVLSSLSKSYAASEQLYQELLAKGLPKELARLVLPVARYSKMRATANLRNWLAFLTLREDPSAQWEIRQYAMAVSNIIKHCFPRVHQLYTEGEN